MKITKKILRDELKKVKRERDKFCVDKLELKAELEAIRKRAGYKEIRTVIRQHRNIEPPSLTGTKLAVTISKYVKGEK